MDKKGYTDFKDQLGPPYRLKSRNPDSDGMLTSNEETKTPVEPRCLRSRGSLSAMWLDLVKSQNQNSGSQRIRIIGVLNNSKILKIFVRKEASSYIFKA